jgi:hypothetical protein
MMLRCGVLWMLRTTCMVRKYREQIQEGIKVVVKMIERKENTKNKEEYIEKENKRTAPAGKTNREQVAVQLRK